MCRISHQAAVSMDPRRIKNASSSRGRAKGPDAQRDDRHRQALPLEAALHLERRLVVQKALPPALALPDELAAEEDHARVGAREVEAQLGDGLASVDPLRCGGR